MRQVRFISSHRSTVVDLTWNAGVDHVHRVFFVVRERRHGQRSLLVLTGYMQAPQRCAMQTAEPTEQQTLSAEMTFRAHTICS